jgi:hypothetical protein
MCFHLTGETQMISRSATTPRRFPLVPDLRDTETRSGSLCFLEKDESE